MNRGSTDFLVASSEELYVESQMDIFLPEKRSEIMSRITGKDTKPEIAVRRMLHKMGYRFRKHTSDLPGKPDICLPKYKTVILVHGCYWHRHNSCKRGQSVPSSNMDFWTEKFEGTIGRDKKVKKALSALGSVDIQDSQGA